MLMKGSASLPAVRSSQGHSRLRAAPKAIAWSTLKSRQHSSDSHLPGNSNLPQPIDLLERYRGLVALGAIKYDEEQVRVVMQLRKLQRQLINYAPPAAPAGLLRSSADKVDSNTPWWSYNEDENDILSEEKSIVRKKGHAEELASLDTPKGLLLTGPPGSGKSFLVDLWFSSLPTPFKARKHYNQLVLEVYRGVWEETQRRMTNGNSSEPLLEPKTPWNRAIRSRWQELLRSGASPAIWNRSSAFSSGLTASGPTIAFVIARRLILNHWLLVFDEIQLLDVSSANLLADILSWYWRMGGVIVGTSNKVPEDLYQNGVQRERLGPFVEALKARCPVVTMESHQDWRVVRGGDGTNRSWFKKGQESKFHKYLASITSSKLEPTTRVIYVFGRPLFVPWTSGDVCKFTFAQICEESLGPADYLSIASHFRTIVITSIPTLQLSIKDQARRFISLIDALYESRCRIVCLAESEPEELFFPETLQDTDSSNADVMMAESVSESQDVYRPNVSSYNSSSMQEAARDPDAMALDTLSIFSGQDEQFAFKRALSRLVEMTSVSYGLDEQWKPLSTDSRRWEGHGLGQTSSWTNPHRRPDSQDVQLCEDFAAEASYSNIDPRKGRPDAPRLKNDHVWGVRDDWGKGAKSWGQGSKAYEGKSGGKQS